MRTGKTHIDQYDLVLTGIRIVNKCTGGVWVASFRRVNLDPRERLTVDAWCQKIKQFLAAGEAFKDKDPAYSPWDMINMLPTMWHGMEPAKRKGGDDCPRVARLPIHSSLLATAAHGMHDSL